MIFDATAFSSFCSLFSHMKTIKEAIHSESRPAAMARSLSSKGDKPCNGSDSPQLRQQCIASIMKIQEICKEVKKHPRVKSRMLRLVRSVIAFSKNPATD